MMSDDSDIELKNALPMKNYVKQPASPTDGMLSQPKKISTKAMIYEALAYLKSRKGVSLYAIKKFIASKYDFDTEKMNYLIKKQIKAAIEEGTVIQIKGIGASGSFKLVAVKEQKKPKKLKKSEEITKKLKKTEKTNERKSKTNLKSKEKVNKMAEKGTKMTKSKEKAEKIVKVKSKKIDEKKVNSQSEENKSKESKKETSKIMKKDITKEKIGKKNKNKMAKNTQTPTKKRAAVTKRKSIGSIIKPPKMKPQA